MSDVYFHKSFLLTMILSAGPLFIQISRNTFQLHLLYIHDDELTIFGYAGNTSLTYGWNVHQSFEHFSDAKHIQQKTREVCIYANLFKNSVEQGTSICF